ncbi:hypothetical protein LAD67_09685 [Escherichia coli]|nr:hypothetical protein [Escherichia coli]
MPWLTNILTDAFDPTKRLLERRVGCVASVSAIYGLAIYLYLKMMPISRPAMIIIVSARFLRRLALQLRS